MRGYGHGERYRPVLSIYLAFLLISSVKTGGLFPFRLTSLASACDSVSKSLLLSLEDRDVKLTEVTDASDVTAHPSPSDGTKKVEKIQQQTLQSSSQRRKSKISLSFRKEDDDEKFQTLKPFPELQSVPEELKNLLSVLSKHETRLLSLASSRLIEERGQFSSDRKLMSNSLPVEPKPIEGHNNSSSGSKSETVPSLPVEGSAVPCDLDILDLNFGGVQEACVDVKHNDSLRRRRCCPVLAAWLYSAHAKRAVLTPVLPESFEMPVPPDDSQICSSSLQSALQNRNINLSPPNASCDLLACFCGIRLHEIESVSCPVGLRRGSSFEFTETPLFRSMEANCSNSSYAGCTACLSTLEAPLINSLEIEAVTSNTYAADCRMTGLLWLLATNRTLYLPSVSAVLRATVYQSGPFNCSLDDEDVPLAYDNPLAANSQALSQYQMSLFVPIVVLLLNCFWT